ncbi:MAG: PKD domain-containing protein, partial [Flavobacteriales bacterium]
TWVASFDQTQNLQLTGYYEDCESVVDVEFLVYQLPVVDLPIQNEVCFNEDDILFDMGTPNLDGVGVYYVESVVETAFDTGMPASQSYEVVYAFTDVNGCYSADTSQVLINPLPIVDLPDFDDLCISEEVLVFNSGTPIGGDYFVNDVLSPDFDPISGEGVYSINYSFIDVNGCSGSADNEIQVNPLPVPTFVAADLCYGELLLVENNSTIPNGSIDSHEWNFGGIQTSLMENPNLVDLGVPGVYDVQLINTSAEGCQDSLTQQVQVLTSPEVDFTIEDDCLAELFDFTDLTEVIGGTIDQWEWRIDGSPVSLDQNVVDHQFVEWGSYEIQLLAVSNEACADSMSQMLQVHAMPTPDFAIEDFCADVNAELNNFSNIENGSIDQFVWNAGDGSAAQNELNFNHIYNAPGFYPVTLTATSDRGCEESIEQIIQVFAAPEIQVGQDAFADCGLAQVNFEDFSVADGSSIVSWQWTMNGELISGLPTAIFNPDGPGTYDIELLVSSAQGCLSDTVITDAFEVYPFPSIDYVANPAQVTMLSPELNITDQTTDAIYWEFSLPNGDQIEANEIDYLFTEAGEYHFDLYVENDFGCGDSTRIFIEVLQEILVHIPNAFSPDGDGLNEVFVPVLNDIDVEEYEFEIYNRWGEVIFTTDQPGKGWKGDVRNGDYFAQNGVYTYKLILTESTLSDTREFTGHVTLLR